MNDTNPSIVIPFGFAGGLYDAAKKQKQKAKGSGIKFQMKSATQIRGQVFNFKRQFERVEGSSQKPQIKDKT